jgi:hypothetical protein
LNVAECQDKHRSRDYLSQIDFVLPPRRSQQGGGSYNGVVIIKEQHENYQTQGKGY